MSKAKKEQPLTIEERYKNKTHHNHILEIPDTYIGSVNNDIIKIYTFDDETNKIVFGEKNINEGLYKIFDEILVNASDNSIRDLTQDTIKVSIDEETGLIEIYNNGKSIPLEIHKELNIYVPEMIFSKLLSSENYDTKGKIVGGKNGYGAKLTNIYSSYFEIEVVNTEYGKKYNQVFRNNMFDREEPVIKKCSSKDTSYVKIKFIPDYNRFGIDKLTTDMMQLFKRRVYDIAGTAYRKMNIYYNNVKLNIHSFEDYIKLYYNNEPNIIYQQFNERWTVGVVYDTESGHKHISFVNRISTGKGGTHVKYILDQIIDKIAVAVKKKNKTLDVKPTNIKDNLTVFINSIVEDPDFGSQSKDILKTKQTSFNIGCTIDDKFIKKICDTGLLDDMIKLSEFKKSTELEKMNKTVKQETLRDIENLEDAIYAGKKTSQNKYLILTEGLSAKTLAVSGLSVIGNEYFGIFPLKGKIMNIRDASNDKISKNEEIHNLMRIIGLKMGAVYEDTKKLRYDGVIIFTDSDVDGHHIKGLLMNLFHKFWPSLLELNFITSLETPILKIYKMSDIQCKTPIGKFNTLLEYNDWVKENNTKHRVKYFKGLGSSTSADAKEIFNDIHNKLLTYITDSKSKEDAIVKLFDKNLANERKELLKEYHEELYPNVVDNQMTFNEFIFKVMIHFSNDDNNRSLPNLIDGFKPSQRKIIYGCFKRNLISDLKVSQLAGYVGETAGYHHGEMSLVQTIVAMAQNYVNSNNINLLFPNGGFGSRDVGGKDHASARYIFTYLEGITSLIFKKEDESILKYKIEDGDSVEPYTYYPIIPMILINGVVGIGTGYSTEIPPFNPLDVIENIKLYLEDRELNKLIPWYRNFTGRIEEKTANSYNIYGTYTQLNENEILVTELPIGSWTNDYKKFLNELIKKNTIIDDYEPTPLENKVHIVIRFKNGELQKLIKSSSSDKNSIEKELKLVSSISLTNMNCFKDNVITKYNDPNEMLIDYAITRLEKYEERRQYIIKKLEEEMRLLHYKKKFIEQKLNGKIVIERRKKDDIIDDLIRLKYPKLSNNEDKEPSYDYLTSILLFHFTEEKIQELNDNYNKKEEEVNYYKNITSKELWINELDELKEFYVTKFLPENTNDKGKVEGKKSKKKKTK